jgi:hypothetical protein
MVFKGESNQERKIYSFTELLTLKSQWGLTSDGYIGLELIFNNNIYFGWVRPDISNSSSEGGFIVKDYLYNSKPT